MCLSLCMRFARFIPVIIVIISTITITINIVVLHNTFILGAVDRVVWHMTSCITAYVVLDSYQATHSLLLLG